jgi:tRNA A-37 threonylcarbamoyl transferase component Bud32
MAGLDCVTEADLRAWLLGELPEAVSRRVTEHLETCPQCEAAARHLDGLADPFLDSLRRRLSAGRESDPRLRPPADEDATQIYEPPRIGPIPAAEKEPPSIAGYEILGELGRGGMSVVYKARQLRPDRVVALKCLLAGAHAVTERRARFLAEADAIARLQHPHIVQIYEVGQQDGVPYLALEYLGGGSLATWLRGRLPPSHLAAALVETLARAVQYAHEQGVIHRDLKPANVLLGLDGQAKVSDFGLAKHERPDLTATGEVLGTPSYMAPEQAAGRGGPAADIYALGALLYELLTGRPPFRAATVLETLEQVRKQEPVPPARLQPGLPRDLETIALKCLHKEPTRRYARAVDLAEDLRRFLAGEPIRARPAGRGERLLKWVRRKPTAAALLGTLLLTLVSSAAAGLWLREQSQQARATALVEALTTAEPAAVAGLLDQLQEYRGKARPSLAERLGRAEPDSRAWLHLRLALLPEDAGQRDVLAEYLLHARPDELALVRDQLAPHGAELAGRFWAVLTDPPAGGDRRGLAACALAAFAPRDPRWQTVRTDVASLLVRKNPQVAVRWAESLRPMRAVLLPPLAAVFRDPERPEAERLLAANLLADYAEDQPALLTEILLEADAVSFGFLFDKLAARRGEVLPLLRRELTDPASPWPQPRFTRDFGKLLVALVTEPLATVEARLAHRQARAVLALARLGECDPLWQRLRLQPDPTLRSYLVNEAAAHQLAPLVLVDRLAEETDVSARRALLLALGEYPVETLPADLRRRLQQQLLEQYRDEPDAGVHGALDWLLRQRWGQARAGADLDTALRGRPPGGRRWLENGLVLVLTLAPGPDPSPPGAPVW